MTAQAALRIALPETVVVTGAASGLGLEVCKLLLDSGAKAVGIDVATAPPELAARPDYAHHVGDVASEAFWAQMAGLLRARAPSSIGLVTSAAVLEVGNILEIAKAQMTRSFDVNVIGTALAMKALIPRMIELGGGAIVAVASIDATMAEQQLPVYCATKGAVRQIARTIAMDHARQGIRVNVLSPGPMMAGLFQRHLQSAADPDKFLATRSARQPNGRILDPRDVAKAALFLLSDACGAINGAELLADGGLSTSFDFRTGAEGASI